MTTMYYRRGTVYEEEDGLYAVYTREVFLGWTRKEGRQCWIAAPAWDKADLPGQHATRKAAAKALFRAFNQSGI